MSIIVSQVIAKLDGKVQGPPLLSVDKGVVLDYVLLIESSFAGDRDCASDETLVV